MERHHHHRAQSSAGNNQHQHDQAEARPLPRLYTHDLPPAYLPRFRSSSTNNFTYEVQPAALSIPQPPAYDTPSAFPAYSSKPRRSYLRSFPAQTARPSKIPTVPSRTLRARDWFAKYFLEWWAMEIIAWCFSAACMATIVGVLRAYNGSSPPHWRLGLSLNAMIAVLSGFARSALMLSTAEALGQLKWNWFRKAPRSMLDFERLDMASRGPWGSLLLLMRLRGL